MRRRLYRRLRTIQQKLPSITKRREATYSFKLGPQKPGSIDFSVDQLPQPRAVASQIPSVMDPTLAEPMPYWKGLVGRLRGPLRLMKMAMWTHFCLSSLLG